MAIGSATSGSQSISQSIVQQLRLQEAKRAADEAQYRAQTLQAQANDAQATADRDQERARSLRVDASQAQTQAGQATQGLMSIQSLSQMSSALGNSYTQIAQAQHSTPTHTNPQPQKIQQSVVNTQGQTIGKVVNVTA